MEQEDFIKRMLTLGAELDKTTTKIEENMIIHDARIAYNSHIMGVISSFNNRN